MNLLYSDEIKPNFLSYGEKSDVVLACQERLKELGYLTTTPDGAYGEDTGSGCEAVPGQKRPGGGRLSGTIHQNCFKQPGRRPMA